MKLVKTRNQKHATRRRAFTLLEMMLVVVIIGVLATVAVVAVGGRSKTAKIGATKASMKTIDSAIEQFHLEKNRYPSSLQELSPSYLKSVAKDAWKRDFQYAAPAPSGKAYDVISFGEDGQLGGGDDISVWTMDQDDAAPATN